MRRKAIGQLNYSSWRPRLNPFIRGWVKISRLPLTRAMTTPILPPLGKRVDFSICRLLPASFGAVNDFTIRRDERR
jgi:hypothetical protein